MSITNCARCERQVDTDFEEMSDESFKLRGEEVCLDCEGEHGAHQSEAAFESLMDDMQVLYGLKAGHVVTQADIDALNRLDAHWREDGERVLDAYARGWKDALQHAGGDALVQASERADAAEVEAATQRMLTKFAEQSAFIRGAAECREIMARFVEQGGSPVMANSIRLNWNPEWGADPAKKEG